MEKVERKEEEQEEETQSNPQSDWQNEDPSLMKRAGKVDHEWATYRCEGRNTLTSVAGMGFTSAEVTVLLEFGESCHLNRALKYQKRRTVAGFFYT